MRVKLYSIGIGVSIFWMLLLPFDHPILQPLSRGIQFPFVYLLQTLEPQLVFETDTLGTYFLGICALIIGTLFSFWIEKGLTRRGIPHEHVFRFTLASILAYFLLFYGWAKIDKSQFYLPEPNTLYTPLGQLSKDIAFWSLIGSSYPLTFALGALELFVGIGLIFQRTRFLASLLSVILFSIIFSINIAFDISVKYLSGSLLLFSLFLSFSFRNEWRFLFGRIEKTQVNTRTNKTTVLRQVLFASGLVLFIVLSNVIRRGWNDDLQPRPPLHGAFKIIDGGSLKRVFVHRTGYLIVEVENFQFYDFPAHFTKSEVIVDKQKVNTSGKLFIRNGDYFLAWNKHIYPIQPLPYREMPLLRNQIHPTADQFHK